MEPGQDWKVAALTFNIYVHFFYVGDIMDELYMQEALKEAKKAFNCGEVPIGAVIVENNEIIARSHNTKDIDNCAIFHAEINAIKEASSMKNNWRLNDCIMYVTLFPCPMCASAINQSRMSKIVYGATSDNVDYNLVDKILNDKNYGNPVEITGRILEEECGKILKEFFLKKR